MLSLPFIYKLTKLSQLYHVRVIIVLIFKGVEMDTERFSLLSKVEQPVNGSASALTCTPAYISIGDNLHLLGTFDTF